MNVEKIQLALVKVTDDNLTWLSAQEIAIELNMNLKTMYHYIHNKPIRKQTGIIKRSCIDLCLEDVQAIIAKIDYTPQKKRHAEMGISFVFILFAIGGINTYDKTTERH